MESMIKQRRASFSESGQRNNEETSKDKKTPNWFQRQFYRGNSQDYESMDGEYVVAIAAATFAVHSFEEKMSSQHQKRPKTREEVEASMRTRTSHVDKAPSLARPSRPREANANRSLSIYRSGNTNVDAREKAELQKIHKRCEKSRLTILAWENEKKTRAKRRMEEKKKELDQRRSINWQHYQNKLARIDHVAQGARKQVEEKKNRDEKKVKGRATEMRSFGTSSSKYFICC